MVEVEGTRRVMEWEGGFLRGLEWGGGEGGGGALERRADGGAESEVGGDWRSGGCEGVEAGDGDGEGQRCELHCALRRVFRRMGSRVGGELRGFGRAELFTLLVVVCPTIEASFSDVL